MVLEKIRGIAKKSVVDEEFDVNEDYIEVDVSEAEKKQGKVIIRVDKLESFSDTERVVKHLRDGALVFLKIKNLREKDMGDLKRSVERIKKTIIAIGGDIVGIEQDWLILTPDYARIER
ncbi:MAG TPA: cell division protein SepF [Candidatus Aenigmarchaeota archaeon]|nr:MAG: hypothetical protein DRP03_00355 [Candidatus Aenigmarchaeota archaeon]HDD46479.1 cell division protein SepF [Candidatus Aenigmarchaeota archaeon]